MALTRLFFINSRKKGGSDDEGSEQKKIAIIVIMISMIGVKLHHILRMVSVMRSKR